MLANPERTPLGYWSGVILGLLAFTCCEIRVLRLIGNEQHGLDESIAITTGHAEWAAYQNRIAGPYAVLLVSRLTGRSYAKCYHALTDLLLFVANACAFVLVRRRERSTSAGWSAAFVNAGLFLVFQDNLNLYLWDCVDAVTMLFFAYGIVTGASLWFFVVVYLVELTNREAAQFVALWIVLLGAQDLVRPATRQAIWHAPSQLALGLVLLAFASWWVAFLRTHLLRSEPGETSRGVALLWGQHYRLPSNLRELQHPVDLNTALVWLILLFLGILFCRAVPVLGRRAVPLALLLLAMLLATFLFALVIEARVWITFIPFLLFLWRAQGKEGTAYCLARKETRQDGAGQLAGPGKHNGNL